MATASESVQVLYPASDPVVTGVGATSLYLNSTTDSLNSETAWTAYPDTANNSGANSDYNNIAGSSGGGNQPILERGPPTRTGTGVPSGSRCGCVPDVAFVGDPNTGVLSDLQRQGRAGWRHQFEHALLGGHVRVDQPGPRREPEPVGARRDEPFLLYPLLGTASFRDITSGDNYVYFAGTGYDLVTGIGVAGFQHAVVHPGRLFLLVVTRLVFRRARSVGGQRGLLPVVYRRHASSAITPILSRHERTSTTSTSGYEYVFNANDGQTVASYFYDFASSDVLLHVADLSVPVPVRLHAEHRVVLLPEPERRWPGYYTTNPRYFYDLRQRHHHHQIASRTRLSRTAVRPGAARRRERVRFGP